MKPAIVMIDFQRHFFRTEERRESLETLIPAANELIDYGELHGIPVFQVITLHKEDKSTWNLVMKKYNEGALYKGSEGAKLLSEVHQYSNQIEMVKTRQSTFIRTDFEEQLRSRGIDTVILGGVFIHGCVGRTAVDAYERDFHVILAKDAAFSHVKDQEKAMLDVILYEQEQKVLSNKEIIEYLESRSNET